jgi:HTH-type transcriptional regulator / antitoxin HigA
MNGNATQNKKSWWFSFCHRNINNEKYYKMALNKVRVLMKLKPSKESEEGQELEMLITLIEAYEDVHVLMGV